MTDYDHTTIESTWQRHWEESGLYRARVDWSRPKHYALTMLPYPSGDLHIGHWYSMTPPDARARYMRMKGYNVLFPMGFDAFGLPAENAAVQRNIHPATWTKARVECMRRQMKSMGTMIDWEREIVSCEPEYYRWTRMALQAALRARPRLPGRGPGQLVADAADGAGQRAGHRRQGRAHRPAGGSEADGAVVLPPSPNMPTSCSASTASTGPSRCGPCRPTGSADPRVPRSVFPTAVGRGHPDLHDPPGHAVGGDLHGARPRAPAGRRPHHATTGAVEVDAYRDAGGAQDRAGADGGEQVQDRRVHRRVRHQPGQRRGDTGLGGRLRAAVVRHRGDHGGARPRPARLRVRPPVRVAGGPA